MFPTALGWEMAKERIAELHAGSEASDRRLGGRRRTWRRVVGSALVATGERLRGDETFHPPDPRLVRLP